MALNLFEAARKRFCVEEIITIGSTCQYPATLKPPFKIADMWNGYPEATNGPYGIAKRFACEIGESYAKQYKINHKHIILANLYGPGDVFDRTDSHVIPALIQKFCHDDCVEIWGCEGVKREFLYVEDAAKIIKKLADKKFSGIVNVGSGEEVTIHELAGVIGKEVDYRGDFVYNVDMPTGQKGKTKLKDGIKKTIAWYRGIRD
jgi:GDP-L-fucose synthase